MANSEPHSFFMKPIKVDSNPMRLGSPPPQIMMGLPGNIARVRTGSSEGVSSPPHRALSPPNVPLMDPGSRGRSGSNPYDAHPQNPGVTSGLRVNVNVDYVSTGIERVKSPSSREMAEREKHGMGGSSGD